jgi:amidase
MMMVELAVAHEKTYPAKKERYGKWVSSGIEIGLAAKPIDLARVSILRDQYKGQLLRVFSDVDAILLPIFRDGTPTWDHAIAAGQNDMNGFMRFTAPLNATGSPTVTMPCGYTADMRPVGFQLVGAHCSEDVLLRVAHAYQQATDWHVRHPVVQGAVELAA